MVAARAANAWQRYDIRQIEDLRNAVLGADLDAIHMAGPPLGGSLAFGAREGIIYSSGSIRSRVALRGLLSDDALTVLLGLRLTSGSRLWLEEVQDGDIGIIPPGAECDAIFAPGSLYIAATLTRECLEKEMAREGVAIPKSLFTRTGLHATPIAGRELIWARSRFTEVHGAVSPDGEAPRELDETMLRLVLDHYGRFPESGTGRLDPQGRARVVRRALEYIRENLSGPITMDALIRETNTPRRSLYRAFLEVLDDTPQGYVRRLRLHRIRRDLLEGVRSKAGIAEVARGWCAGSDLGRMAGRYQSLFGESPRATVAARTRLTKKWWL